MTAAERDSAIARCDREQREMRARGEREPAPAFLVAMGIEDWEREKREIEAEFAQSQNARGSRVKEERWSSH